MTIKSVDTLNLQQTSKADQIPLGKFFDELKEKFKDTPVRFIRTDFPPLEIHHFIKAQADDAFIIPPTPNKDCGCPLHLHVSKPRSRTMLNALKIEAKRHNKRKGSEVYHKRIQKKWDKRVLKEGSACNLSVQVPVQVSMAQNFSNLLISLES